MGSRRLYGCNQLHARRSSNFSFLVALRTITNILLAPLAWCTTAFGMTSRRRALKRFTMFSNFRPADTSQVHQPRTWRILKDFRVTRSHSMERSSLVLFTRELALQTRLMTELRINIASAHNKKDLDFFVFTIAVNLLSLVFEYC